MASATVNRIRLWRHENRVVRVTAGGSADGVILIKRILIRLTCGGKQLVKQ